MFSKPQGDASLGSLASLFGWPDAPPPRPRGARVLDGDARALAQGCSCSLQGALKRVKVTRHLWEGRCPRPQGTVWTRSSHGDWVGRREEEEGEGKGEGVCKAGLAGVSVQPLLTSKSCLSPSPGPTPREQSQSLELSSQVLTRPASWSPASAVPWHRLGREPDRRLPHPVATPSTPP